MLSEYPYHPNDAFQGGIMQSTAQLVNSISRLKDRNFDLEIITLSKEAQSFEKRQLNDNISIIFIPNVTGNLLKALILKPYYMTLFMYCVFRSDADIIHGQGTILYNTIATLTNKKSINTIHGIYKNELKVLGSVSWFFRMKNQLKLILESFYLSRIQNLIAISDEIINLVTSCTPVDNIAKINNAIDEVFFEVGTKPKQKDTQLRLLFVAAITPRKGLHNLLKVLRGLNSNSYQLKLTIAGIETWFPEYVKDLKDEYHDLIISEMIEFKGEISQIDLVDLYSKTDFLILPSLAESAPMVVAQSLATGTPVIGSDVGEIRNMLSNGEFGILTIPNDVADLEYQIKYVLDQDTPSFDRIKMIEWASSQYRQLNIAKQTTEFYEKVITPS